MANLPNNLKQIALFFERLPGIGQKTANRLAFYLLRLPQEDLQTIANHFAQVKTKTKMCQTCQNITENEICEICDNSQRDKTLITVVEDALDILSFETGNIYQGVYHVLHGRIDPLNHISPEDIFIEKLLQRVEKGGTGIKEIILATNPDMEGEATAMYIKKKLQAIKTKNNFNFKITRLGYGLPIGANLEYADYMTLKKSIENRNEY